MNQQDIKSPSDAEFIQQRSKGRRTFIFIALLFFGPFVLAALAHKLGWTPQGDSVNKGSLVQVEEPLLEQMLSVDGREEDIQLRKKWSLLLFIPDECDETCKADIDKFEVVHFRLNRNIERVQIVAVNDKNIVKSPFARKVTQGESSQALQASMQKLNLDSVGLYVVDPRGFVVSQYDLKTGAEALQKDLKRLLKYSRVG